MISAREEELKLDEGDVGDVQGRARCRWDDAITGSSRQRAEADQGKGRDEQEATQAA